MHRRRFLNRSLLAGTALAGLQSPMLASASPQEARDFSLTYAPHLGMFVAHAGENLLDQLRFAAA